MIPEKPRGGAKLDRLTVVAVTALAIACAIGLAITIRSGLRNDYALYVGAWSIVNDGGDPWYGLAFNAYGPAFNAMAPLLHVDELVAKVLFTIVWIVLAGVVIASALRNHDGAPGDRATRTWLAAVLVLNPLFLISTALFGTFDVLVAATCIGAVLAFRRDRMVLAGVLIAIGVLLKFYPAVLVPVLAVSCVTRSDRRSFVGASIGAAAAGFLVSLATWGSSTFEPFRTGGERPSTMTSIFRFLRGRWSPLRSVWTNPDVDAVSAPLVVIAVLAVAWYTHRRRLDATVASTLVLAVTFLTYRVGHPQFVQVVVLLSALLIATGEMRGPRPIGAALAYGLWFGFVQVAYVWTAYDIDLPELGFAGEWEWIRDVVSVPSLMVSMWLVFELARLSGPAARDDRAARFDTVDRAAPAIRDG